VIEKQTYVIRRAFLLPLGLLLLECLALLGVVLAQHQPVAKAVILVGMLLPLGLVFLECLVRRVEVGDKDLTMRKLLRGKTLAFADITALEAVVVRKRVYLSLSAGDDFLLISNAYAGFPELLRFLAEKLPEGVVSEETRAMTAAPPVKQSDVVMAWLGVLLMIFILWVQF